MAIYDLFDPPNAWFVESAPPGIVEYWVYDTSFADLDQTLANGVASDVHLTQMSFVDPKPFAIDSGKVIKANIKVVGSSVPIMFTYGRLFSSSEPEIGINTAVMCNDGVNTDLQFTLDLSTPGDSITKLFYIPWDIATDQPKNVADATDVHIVIHANTLIAFDPSLGGFWQDEIGVTETV